VRTAESGRRGETLEGHGQQGKPHNDDAQEGFHTPILARRLSCRNFGLAPQSG
jgi:hypothetical protein